jgi:hypothetical protein
MEWATHACHMEARSRPCRPEHPSARISSPSLKRTRYTLVLLCQSKSWKSRVHVVPSTSKLHARNEVGASAIFRAKSEADQLARARPACNGLPDEAARLIAGLAVRVDHGKKLGDSAEY